MLSCGITMNPLSAGKSLRRLKKSWNAVLPLKNKKQNTVTGIVYPVKFNVGAAVPGLFQERRSEKTGASIRHGAVMRLPSMDFQKRIRQAIRLAVRSTSRFVTRTLC